MRRVIVDPDELNPTHHISLTDGTNTIGLIAVDQQLSANPLAITRAPQQRTALKTTTGNQKYSDFEPPWSPQAQDDFSGGRGSKDYESDVTRYADSYRLNSTFGKLICGPQEKMTTGYRAQDFNMPGSVTWQMMKAGASKYIAYKFKASASYTVATISLLIKKVGTPTQPLVVQLCADYAGTPHTVLETGSVTASTVADTTSTWYDFTISPRSILNGWNNWIKVYSAAGTNNDHWLVAVNSAAGYTKISADDTTYAEATIDLYFRVRTADTDVQKYIFQYKYSRFMLVNSTTGGAPALYINGDRGVADANTGALGTLVDASKTWTTDEWVGCVVYLTYGVGSNESQPWRNIVSNTDTTLTLDDDWIITHDTTTEYAILGSNKWTLIEGHGMTGLVTSVLPLADNLYFAQGDAINIRRANWYNNSGTATWRYADDGTNKAVHLCAVWDATDGLNVWKSNNKDAAGAKSVAVEGAVSTWGNMTFETAITMNDNLGNITGLEEYGNPNTLFIFRAGGVFYIASDKVVEIPLREMHAAIEYTNGIAHTVNNVYLYFNMGKGGIERYYSSNLDDVGPANDEGMPANRDGVVSKMLSYPGRYFAAIDAGASGYSSILVNNLTGWHEIYRAPQAGMRIREIDYESVPGAVSDRLWVCVGDDVIWLHFPSSLMDVQKDTAMRFTHEAVVESAWMYAGLVDIYKFYRSIKLFSENLSDDLWVEADYKVDDDTTWTVLTDKEVFNTSPVQEIYISPGSTIGVNAKRFKYRLRLYTNDNTKTPEVTSVVIDIISRVPIKYSYALPARLRDADFNLRGERDEQTAMDKISILETWANNLTPVTMRCVHAPFDKKTLFIDPPVLTPSAEKSEGYIARIGMNEV